jgi:pimeloyl-ACP methyl ester carboxylesterase
MGAISPALYRAGEGEPVVLLHGATGTWHHWRPVLAELVARYEVIAPTLTGHDGGPPVAPGSSLDMPTGGDALERQLDALGVGAAHFVGNSLGGALSIEMARRGRARSVVAISPAGGWVTGSPDTRRIARFFSRNDRLSRAMLPRLGQMMRSPQARRLAFRDVMRHGELVPAGVAVDMALAGLRCPLALEVIRTLRRGGDIRLGDLSTVTTPVLLAWAELDRVLPPATCSGRYRRELAGAEFRLLPGVGHVPMWDDTRLIVDTIVDWVDRHPASAPQADQAA